MNAKQTKTIQELRKAGYAIAIFTPEEIGEASSWKIEDSMVESGWEIIETMKEEEDD